MSFFYCIPAFPSMSRSCVQASIETVIGAIAFFLQLTDGDILTRRKNVTFKELPEIH